MAMGEVRAVAFDVNETLFALDGLGPAFATVGLDPAAVPLWFARLLRDGFALAAMGRYRRFAEVAAETLRGLDPAIEDAAVAAVLAAFRELDPHPDVAPALRALQAAGVPAVTLTNGGTEVVGALLERAGLDGYVQASFSVDEVESWKPTSRPYRRLAEHLGLQPGQVALVASHPWDCAGAQAAGLLAAWVNRPGARWPAVFPPPDFTAADLATLIAALLGHPAGR
jgi:2-haloacid dehalogenase